MAPIASSASSKTLDAYEKYVESRGGAKIIKRILIANNGMAAMKFIKSVRYWTETNFGSSRTIELISMCSEDDRKNYSGFVDLADSVILVDGGKSQNNYGNVELIVDIAVKNTVDAVWAGWGHASEDPLLPDELAKHDIEFIGPSSQSMMLLGDKVSSTIIAQSVEINCIEWSGTGIGIKIEDGKVAEIDGPTYERACIKSKSELRQIARLIGYPHMIKASEGGGGKGIRLVTKEEELEISYDLVKKEVPGSPIFLMKLCDSAKHLEIQIIGDKYGNYTSLYGRDCTVQRRHQKIIEEGPIVVASANTILKMEECAINLARCVRYYNAGTVEFLYRPHTGDFYFLELNPRLQVEHPVSELITDVNIPAIQVQIAMGIPLHNIPDIRRFYCIDPTKVGMFDMSLNLRNKPSCHVIAARITAENPAIGFRPNVGMLEALDINKCPKVWGYFGIYPGSQIHEYSDSQFGHIFAQGQSRECCRSSLKNALDELRIRGSFANIAEVLIELIDSDEFKSLSYNTSWLDTLVSSSRLMARESISDLDMAICVASYSTVHQKNIVVAHISEVIEKGLMPQKSDVMLHYKWNFFYKTTEFKLESLYYPLKDFVIVVVNGIEFRVQVVQDRRDSGLTIQFSARKRVVYRWELGISQERYLIDNHSYFIRKGIDDSIIESPSPGKLLRFRVNDGDHVTKGQAIAEIEVMKMCMDVCSSKSGRITLIMQPGSIVKCGSLIARIEAEDSFDNSSIELFSEVPCITRQVCVDKYDYACKLLENLEICIFLRKVSSQVLRSDLDDLNESIESDGFFKDYVSHRIRGIDKEDRRLLYKLKELKTSKEIADFVNSQPALQFIREELEKIRTDKTMYFVTLLLCDFLQKCHVISELGDMNTGCLKHMDFKLSLFFLNFYYNFDEGASVFIEIIETLLDIFVDANENPLFLDIVRKAADLNLPLFSKLKRKSRELLFKWSLPSLNDLYAKMEIKFVSAVNQTHDKSLESMRLFVDDMVRGFSTHLDLLPRFFHHEDPLISLLSLEIYIRRISESYSLCSLTSLEDLGRALNWTFGSCIVDGLDLIRRDDAVSPAISDYGEVKDPCNSLDDLRSGVIAILKVSDDLPKLLDVCLRILKKHETNKNVLYFVIAINTKGLEPFAQENQVVNEVSSIALSEQDNLCLSRVSRLTLVVIRNAFPFLGFYTFRSRLGYQEDCTIRHLDPSMAYLLEFNRLSEYIITFSHADPTGQIHIYHGKPASGTNHDRLFVRLVIRPNQIMRHFNTIDELLQEVYRILEDMFECVEAVISSITPYPSSNHLFLNVLPVFVNTYSQVEQLIRTIMTKYENVVNQLHFRQGEVKMNLATARGAPPTRHRFILSNETGYRLDIEGYYEEKDPISGKCFLKPLYSKQTRDIPTIPASLPYSSSLTPIQIKRYRVQSSLATTYVYDFPTLLERAICELIPACELLFEEAFLDSCTNELCFQNRPPGLNKCGMVAWKCTLKSREASQPRQFVMIGNDIDFEIGSFGTQEDQLFYSVSQFARLNGMPRIFLSANSGARIGLAEELLPLFRVAWNDERDPAKGFQYLFLLPEDLKKLPIGSVNTEKVIHDGVVRHKIVDIIGSKDGIGVENLQGSALIAGETSVAYEQTFTITLVTGRSVGIGAYLVRLGQRAIQKSNQPIILTGFAALNSILGRDVYLNNLQLGGPQVMSVNGTSHVIVHNDWEGVKEVARWLFYLPSFSRLLPDSVKMDINLDRPVEVIWETSPESDPRLLLIGENSTNSADRNNMLWKSGVLDKDSFREYLADWAQGVVIGRGRLGGRPIGVIATETRTTIRRVPADPANLDSRPIEYPQAGQVWFPDSAFKTATAIRDFAREKLPVLIIANWRGFSGGQRDLFQEVMKFGAMIVDALASYPMPVFVYIPPKGELRGGSWVVIDSKINASGMIEMYADPSSRGGIMEPQGLVGVKIKGRHYESMMRRLVPQHCENEEQRKQLEPIFQQIAVHYADLHDTPGRMLAKGVIRKVVPLCDCRRVLGLRLMRRLIELEDGVILDDLREAGYNSEVDDDLEMMSFYKMHKDKIDAIGKRRRNEARRRELQEELEKLDQ